MTSYKELLAQRAELDKQIEAARKTELADAMNKVRAIIKEFNLTPAECGFIDKENISAASANSRSPAKPKYISPDGKNVWSGRGRMPKVFQDFVQSGRSIDEFLI